MNERRDFDKEAVSWDTAPRVKIARDVASAIMANVKLSPEMDILDFGCGTGLLSLALLPKARSVIGADTSKGMLDELDKKISEGNIPGIRTVLLKPGQETVIPGKYDLIVSSMALHHVPDIKPLLRSFYAALRPGGCVAFADLDTDGGLFHNEPTGVFHNGFDRQKLKKMLAAAGFDRVSFTTAAEVNKDAADGVKRAFTIFLAVAMRSA